MSKEDTLIEIFNPRLGVKASLTKKDLDKIFEAVEIISKEVKYEIPNSATFSMVIDCLEKNAKIFRIKDAMASEAEELVVVETKKRK